ncbi:MAG: PLP-dependent aminotransferase family protein [Oscillospiraceae bacterium]|nr:PLP-dependent aminotransferase family protein [Oscillospiraceae bacterium]
MQVKISHRMSKPDFQAEFLSSILAAAADPSIISFAGGLPNPDSFPVKAMNEAAGKVLESNGIMALQYSGSQGYLPLRQFICDRYKKMMDLDFDPSDIIITNGSQQALDMFSAVMIDPDDEIMVESPSYLAALQTFHLYYPKVLPIKLNSDGLDAEDLKKVISEHNPKFIYIIPNFQNPTGLTYTEEVRVKVAEVLKGTDIMVLEDNPYGELRFSGKAGHSLHYFLGEQVCMLGTFSKIVAPGMRIGWIACKEPQVRAKLLAYKSTMDLHTNIFGQMVLAQFLQDVDLDAHIETTKELYRQKAEYMLECMDKFFPKEVEFTKPEGGMFVWATMPEGVKAVDVTRAAIEKGVAVCPGDPFYEYERDVRTLRINYSNSTNEDIEKGIKILGDAIKELL